MSMASNAARAMSAAALMVLTAAGCSSSPTPTCQEFAAMGPDTGILVQFNAEQEKAVVDALKETGYDDSLSNQMIARSEVIAYCNIYGGQSGNNQDSPITEAL